MSAKRPFWRADSPKRRVSARAERPEQMSLMVAKPFEGPRPLDKVGSGAGEGAGAGGGVSDGGGGKVRT